MPNHKFFCAGLCQSFNSHSWRHIQKLVLFPSPTQGYTFANLPKRNLICVLNPMVKHLYSKMDYMREIWQNWKLFKFFIKISTASTWKLWQFSKTNNTVAMAGILQSPMLWLVNNLPLQMHLFCNIKLSGCKV